MNPAEAIVGTRVRILFGFANIPKGTEGIIDELYRYAPAKDCSVTVAWNLPDHPLPLGYVAYDGRPAIQSGILRDGFSPNEFQYLEVIG